MGLGLLIWCIHNNEALRSSIRGGNRGHKARGQGQEQPF